MKDTSSGGSSSGGSSGGSSSNGSSTGTTTKPIKPIPPVEKPIKIETISTFNDVLVDAWYAGEVQWVYENGLMVGVGNKMFAPNAEISHAVVVTTLAREGKIDLAQYADLSYVEH